MEPCPFCNTPVDGDLIRFGGTCPSCFGEIPGEEAATDPGEAVKAAQVQQDEARVRRRMMVPAIMGALALLALGSAACLIGLRTASTQTELAIDAALADVEDEVTVDPDAPKKGEGRLVVEPVVVDEATGRVGYVDPRTGEEVSVDEATGTVTLIDEVAGVKRVINAATGEAEVYDLETGERAMVDQTTGMAVVRDEEAGTARVVDPRTGITTVVDEETGAPTHVINPVTGETQGVDEGTGFLVVEDPNTGTKSVVNTATGIVADVDSRTGVAELVNPEDGSALLFDPETEEVATVDPTTGVASFVDEEAGTTTVVDPRSGATAEVDGSTGSATLVNPRTGQTTIVNPEEGTVAKIDPLTGTAITVAPTVEVSDEDLEGIAALPDGRLPSDEELAGLGEDLDDLPEGRIRSKSELTENFQIGELGTAPDAGQGTTSGTRVVEGGASVGSGLSSGPREATVKVDASTDVTTTKASQYTVLGLTPDVSISRREQLGIRLEDDQAIIAMIKRVMDTEIPRLRVCYERRLKQAPELKGRWALRFTVRADGYTEAATVNGLDSRDDQLEACVVEKLKSWQFQKIREDQPIKKTVTFRPS
ncbi:MAG: AgmX/PglI C-terminal domain-containing protein [Proteobacteria bacterium]|nr:AgmX/PglI C-terminal domain-containing protein [Pseudomonadota bacterium]